MTFGLENAGVEPKKIKERYEATVSALKIQSLLGRNIFSMSGGEKQSLAFASVYAMNPSIFVLDEPTANLDADAIDTLRQQIIQIKKEGRTVVIAEHRLFKRGKSFRYFPGMSFAIFRMSSVSGWGLEVLSILCWSCLLPIRQERRKAYP